MSQTTSRRQQRAIALSQRPTVQDIVAQSVALGLPGAAERLRETRVEVTVRIVPLDANRHHPREQTRDLLFVDGALTMRQRADAVARTASLLYGQTTGEAMPTRPQEGGR